MDNGEVDSFAIIAFLSLTGFRAAPMLFTCFAFMEDLIPWEWVLSYILPQQIMNLWVVKIPLFIYSFVIFYIVSGESGRMIQFMLLMIIVPASLWVKSVVALSKIHARAKREVDFLNLCKLYSELMMSNQFISRFLAPGVFSLIRIAVYLSSFLNFMTLKLYKVLPGFVYSFFATGAVLVLTMIGLIVPSCTRLYESSSEALVEWKKELPPSGMNLIRKKYRTLRPLQFIQGFYGLRFSVMNKSCKTSFYEDIVNNTTNLCISVPDSTIDKLIVFMLINCNRS